MLNSFDLANREAWEKILSGHHYDDTFGEQKNDIEFLLSLIGSEPKNILEVCCGTGRVFIPLAKTGHNMTGIDYDIGMLARLHEKAKGLTNIKYHYNETN